MGTRDISKWNKAHDRLEPEVWPYLDQNILAKSKSTIFTIGSCFARNIEEHLDKIGYRVPMLRFRVPKSEWTARPNGILNKYTPASIYQELEWAANIYARDGIVTKKDLSHISFGSGDKFIDLQLGKFIPVDHQRLIERRQQIYDVFKEVFSCELVVITLGLIEAWLDTQTNRYIQEYPFIRKEMRNVSDRFVFKRLNHEECLQLTKQSIEIISKRNPKAVFLLTVSPVPLSSTFTEEDVILANMHSKAKLRSVCGEVADGSKVFYFPSFESVLLTKKWNVWHSDRRHVADEFVAKIINRLIGVHLDCSESRALYNQSLSSSTHDAIPLIEAAIEKEEHSDYYERLGSLLIQINSLTDARQSLARALALNPSNHNAMALLSRIAQKEGDLEASITYIKDAIANAPTGNSALLMQLGDLLREKGEPQNALIMEKKAAHTNPAVVRKYTRTSKRLAEEGKLGPAIAEMRKAIRLKEDDPGLHHRLGNLLMRDGDIEGAEEEQKTAIQLSPEMPGPYMQLSKSYAQKKQIRKAIEMAIEAIRQDDSKWHFHYHLGNLLFLTGDLKQAESALKKTIGIAPSQSGPHFQLSLIYTKQKKMDLALTTIQDAIRLENDKPNYYHHHGSLLLKNGDMDGAERAYQKAIALDPGNPKYNDSLQKLLRKGKRTV